MPAADPVIAAPVFIVHSLDHAAAALKAAVAAGRRVVLLSAPNAGAYAGAGWFRAFVDAARDAVPEAQFSAFLDCGDEAGAVLAALRTEIKGVIFTGRADVARRLADIARQQGAQLETVRPIAAFDLGTEFFGAEATLVARCAELLSQPGAAGSDYATRS
jgi:hypothetical protein